MRKVKTVLQYILTLILALTILTLIVINIFSSTILNEDYVLSKLEEEDYYNKIYEEVISNFEKYINQSGLDEEVLNNIITKEKVEKDTKSIIYNIYDSANDEISTEEIKNNLRQNINVSLKRKLTADEEKSVDSFINTICDEYKTTISNTGYEKSINSVYNDAIKYMDFARKALFIATFICIALIAILTIRRIYRILARFGVAFTVDGLLLSLASGYINLKVRINDITVLNNPISIVLRSILNDCLKRINRYGTILLVLGVLLILLYGIIKSVRKAKRIKEQYTPEN